MKKILLTIISLLFVSTMVFAADANSNCNQIVQDQWKNMTTLTLIGVQPIPLVLKVANIQSLTISKDGSLTIIGKAGDDGSKYDHYQVSVFAYQVTIKTKVTKDTKTKENITDKAMIITTGELTTGKLF